MEERIQRKVEELKMNHPLYNPSLNMNHHLFNPPPTYQSFYQEAVRKKEEAFNEDLKKRMKHKQEEQERIDKSWKEERERQERVKKEDYEQFKLMQEKVERELRTMDEFELDHQNEIIRLICRWNNGKSLESYIQCDRKSPRYWYKIAPELREEAVKIRSENVEREQKILTDRENPDSLLVINDLHAIDCISEEYETDKCWDSASESELLNIALKELNVEIIKRIVRKTYPHKFA